MYLEKALPLIKEIIFEPNLTNDSLNFLKENSLSSIKKNLEKAAFLARANAMELLWGENHPMGYFPKPEKLDHISIEDIKDFYSRHYQNADFSIYISGNYPKNIISNLNELFGRHNTNNITISDKVYKLSNTQNVRNISLNNQVQTAINWTKKCIGPRDADFSKLKIVNTILGGYFGSRLMSNIREDKAYTYGINSLLRASTISNSINIETEVGTEYYEDTIKQIDFELLKLKNDLISESELNLVKNYMSGELLSSFDGVFNHASILKYLDEIKLDFTYFSDYLETIKDITPEEIRNTASKYLDTNSFHKISVG
jgi:predicted Zn-dependent peptidase